MHTSFSTQQVSITVSDSGAIADSTEISFGEYQSGTVYVPAGSGLTSLTWHAAPFWVAHIWRHITRVVLLIRRFKREGAIRFPPILRVPLD